MEAPAQFTFVLDGSTRMFPIPIIVKGDNYIQLSVDGVVVSDRDAYDLVNNQVVFSDTSLLPNGSTLLALVAQSDETLGNLSELTSVETVALNIASVNSVNNNINEIVDLANNLGNVSAVSQLQTDVGLLQAQDVAHGMTLDSHGASIANLNTQVLDMLVTNSVFGVMERYNFALTTDAFPQVIGGYTLSGFGNYVALDTTNGTITPANTGWYRVSFHTTIDVTSASQSRAIAVDLIDNTIGGNAKASAVINIPKDAVYGTGSMAGIVQLVGGHDYVLSVSSSTTISSTVETLNFSIERI